MRAQKSREYRSFDLTTGVILLTAILAGVVGSLALAESTAWPLAVTIPAGLVIGILVGTVGRAVVSGAARGWRNISGRAAVAVAVGIVVGELAAIVVFSSSSQHVLDEQAARQTEAAPAVVQASKQLDQDRQTRATLVGAVDQARSNRDEALVVARCEYNPRPECPQVQITGDPGDGPETRTANEFLADAEQELDSAVAARDGRLPGLDAQIATDALALTQAQRTAVAAADTGLGARWVAMNHYTVANPGALLLRLLTVAFFVLLNVLPLILKVWRGETTRDLEAVAQAERERAELHADTAIAVKRAEIRAAAETLWVERDLESARLGVAAETEIERTEQRRRVLAAGGRVGAERTPDGGYDRTFDGDYLPIAAEAEAASLMAALPAATGNAAGTVETLENLPVKVDAGGGFPAIGDVAGAAARWVRPFVPPIVANAIDATAHPIRTARHVIEEVEEIGLTLKRTRRVVIADAEAGDLYPPAAAFEPEAPIVAGPIPQPGYVQAPVGWYDGAVHQPPLAPADYPAEIPRHEGPWQLPPAY